MRRRGSLERQRERIREAIVADPSRSARSIAKQVGCSATTVCRIRDQIDVLRDGGEWTPDAVPSSRRPHFGSENLLPPAGPGNVRAATHGLYSARMLAPRVEALTDELRGIVPGYEDSDQVVVRALAVALAQVEAALEYANERGMVDGRGNPRPMLKVLNSSLNTATKLCGELGLSPAARRRLSLTRLPGDPREGSYSLAMVEAAREAREEHAQRNGGER